MAKKPSLTQQQIHDLWGEGFTVVPRWHGDPFYISPLIVPAGKAYQWNESISPREGWTPVPAERHPGLFVPHGMTGEIVIGGLRLDERHAEDVGTFHEVVRRKAKKNVDNWFERTGAAGLSGSVTVAGQDGMVVTEIGDRAPLHTKIPDDLLDHLPRLMKQRDNILAEYKRVTLEIDIADQNLRAHAMSSAIIFLRAKIAKENDNDPSADPRAGRPDQRGADTTG